MTRTVGMLRELGGKHAGRQNISQIMGMPPPADQRRERLKEPVLASALAQQIQFLLIGVGESRVAAVQAPIVAVRLPRTVSDILVILDKITGIRRCSSEGRTLGQKEH